MHMSSKIIRYDRPVLNFKTIIYKRNTFKFTILHAFDKGCSHSEYNGFVIVCITYLRKYRKKESDYFTNFEHSSSYVYSLPKIHKNKIISETMKKQQSLRYLLDLFAEDRIVLHKDLAVFRHNP